MMDAARQVGVDHRGLAGGRAHLAATELDHFLAADRHLDQREGVEHAGVDGDVAAVAHAPHADAAEAPVVDARIDRGLMVLIAQMVFAEDAFSPSAGFFEVLRVAYLEIGQNGVRGGSHGKSQTLHIWFSLYLYCYKAHGRCSAPTPLRSLKLHARCCGVTHVGANARHRLSSQPARGFEIAGPGS
ncbi:hypothetical protein D3C78_1263710 [compost metagenome]